MLDDLFLPLHPAMIVPHTLYSCADPSPLASTITADLETVIKEARALNLSVFLSPVLDPSWDVPSNARSIDPPFFPYNATSVSRGMIGLSFTPKEWDEWFVSYVNSFSF